MAYVSLAGMAKVTIAGVVAGGVLISGITWQGDGSVTNIRGNIDSLKGKLTQAIDDNTFLSGQFNSLKGLYSEAVTTANTNINTLKAQVSQLTSDLQAKQAELDALKADSTANTAELEQAKTDLQGEISRLEAELDEANRQIAELEAHSEEADSSTPYTATDRNAYTVEEQQVEGTGTTTAPETAEPTPEETAPTEPEPFVSAEATALNPTASAYLAEESNITAQESAYLNAYRHSMDIVGVTTYKTATGSTVLAYEVTGVDVAQIASPAPSALTNVVMNAGVYSVYYIDANTGAVLFSVDKNGFLDKSAK